jgi:hypothetical protein
MKKNILKISGIIFLLVFSVFTIPIIAEPNNIEPVGRTKIIAIGTFAHCDTDEIVYGHIFIGLIGIRPVFNSNIEICDNSISSIIMMNHFIRCVVTE